MKVTKDSKVLDILKAYPTTVKIFDKFQLHPFRNINNDLETVAFKNNADLEAVLKELNNVITGPSEAGEAVRGVPHGKIHQNMTFRLVTTRYPATRNIFAEHGVLELAEKHWPDENIFFFAMALHMPPDKLVDKLTETVEGVSKPAAGVPPFQPEDIHINFIKVAVIFALTTGCLYGAGILFYFGMNGALHGVPRAMLEAHGHTQIYGWVGLFIMGISYFALPRFWNASLYNVLMAKMSLIPMTIGITLVFLSRHLLLMGDYIPFRVMAIGGSLIEVAAICLFMYIMVNTYRSNTTRKFEVYEAYFFVGYVWFLIQGVIFVGTMVYMAYNGLNTIPRLVEQPLLHMQIMGFACMAILGILTKTLPVFLGIKEPRKDINLYVFLLLNTSILLRVVSLVLKETYPLFQTAFLAAGCLEALAILLFFYNLRLHHMGEIDSGIPRKEYRKFIQASLFWFLMAESALLYFNINQFYTGTEVSYALFGAYRHAIFVGFITMMILGCASKMIPMSLGTQLYSYRALFWTFILLNTGSILRVTCQPLAADYNMSTLFLPMGISGFLEYGAIFLFGYNVWKTVGQRQVQEEQEMGERITVVTPETNVYQLIKQHPQALDVLVSHGFKQLKNPVLLNTVARTVNIGAAATIHTTDLDSLLKKLNEAINKKTPQTQDIT
ncbi:MAG: DUF1858 domain-containing protein [Candidatus Brocadiales bacterium]